MISRLGIYFTESHSCVYLVVTHHSAHGSGARYISNERKSGVLVNESLNRVSSDASVVPHDA